MRQLIYNDGSQSDTTIEVKLRHPGERDRNIVSKITFKYQYLHFFNIIYLQTDKKS